MKGFESMETISTKMLREMRSEHPNLLVVNVLEEKDYDEMHLPKSVCIPVDDVDFVERVRDAVDGDLDIPIVVYCSDESCPKSEFAAERLEAAGFEKVLDFEGGVKAWKNNDLPLEGTKVKDNGLSRKSKASNGGQKKETKQKQEGKSSEETSDKEESKAEEKQEKGKEKSKQSKDKSEQAEDKAEEESEKEARAKEESGSESEDTGKKKQKEAAAKEKKKPKAKSKAKSDESKEKTKSAFKREATAEWRGMLKDGTGRMILGSASGVNIPYTFATMAQNVAQKLIASHLVEGEMCRRRGNRPAHRSDPDPRRHGHPGHARARGAELDRAQTEVSVQYVDHNLIAGRQQESRRPSVSCKRRRRFGLWFSRRATASAIRLHQERFGSARQDLLGFRQPHVRGRRDRHAGDRRRRPGSGPGDGRRAVLPQDAGDLGRRTGRRAAGLGQRQGRHPRDAAPPRRQRRRGPHRRILRTRPGCALRHGPPRHRQHGRGARRDHHGLSLRRRGAHAFCAARAAKTTGTESCLPTRRAYDVHDTIDLSQLEPLIAMPSSPGNVKPVREVAGRTEIYQATSARRQSRLPRFRRRRRHRERAASRSQRVVRHQPPRARCWRTCVATDSPC
jgi:rhodanese-related sulfurtransferase